MIATNAAENVTILNKVAEKLTGWKQEEAVGRPLRMIFHIINEDTREADENPENKVIQSGLVIGLANHTALISKYGTERSIADSAAPIKDNEGNIQGVVLVFRDVTEEKRRQDEIHYISYHDSLTGLYNRRFLEEELKRIDRPDNLPISIIMGDVNGLKLINDAFGHSRGDELLQKASEAIQGGCRMDDIAARWGGDEFVILLPKTDALQAERVIGRIQEICAEMKVSSMRVSVSFGSSTKTDPCDDILQVLKAAEGHMYENKIVEGESMRGRLVTTVLGALYRKSAEEERHSTRVSELCRETGRAMGFTGGDLVKLRGIGLLHDIGKIAISEAILNKPGKLTPRERDEIRRHPDIGSRILSSSRETAGLADYVLAHHERFDGSGYPKGLKGDEIPLLARIVSVADAYDAMTGDRRYRPAMDKKAAAAELKAKSGSQFDPAVVGAFLEKVL